ncbi:heme-binding domain-containing protein [Leptospira sp. 96542]|nr:heme-binding domain-containing protein [Leptospira sp. 96542]
MKRLFSVLILFFLILQFYPVSRENKAINQPIQVPKDVEAILRKSCYDCHSFETKWPMYSYVFPISLFVTKHVNEGREELNFSELGAIAVSKQNKKIYEIWEEIEENKMPPWDYKLLHPEANLKPDEIQILRAWVLAKERESE